MIKPRLVLLTAALLALSTASARAEFTGSLGLTGDNPTQNGENLRYSTVFSTEDIYVSSNGANGFDGAVSQTSFGSLTLDLSVANGFGFRLHNDDWGTFTASAGRINDGDVPNNLILHVTGDFVGAGNTINESGTFSAIITFTQEGDESDLGSLVQQISIRVPANFAIPEPSAVALGAIGLVSLGLVALRRRSAS